LSGAIFSNIYFFRAVGERIHFAVDLPGWKRILVQAIPNAVGGAFGSWYVRIGTVILGWHWASSTVGEYSAAFRIFDTTYIVPAAIMAIGIPHLAEAKAKGRDAFSRELIAVIGLMAALAALWGAGMFAATPLIIQRVFGQQYAGAAPVLRTLAVVAGVVFFDYGITCLMVVINRQRRHAVHEMIVFLVSLALYRFLIPKGGALGAARALLGCEALRFCLTAGYLLSHWKSASPDNFGTIEPV
jgi:O-antigen/teichoic acid export membrane protein